jgi:hypothetical protein
MTHANGAKCICAGSQKLASCREKLFSLVDRRSERHGRSCEMSARFAFLTACGPGAENGGP